MKITEDIPPAPAAIGHDLLVDIALQNVEKAALIGYVWCHLNNDKSVSLDFGRWNDRSLNPAHAKAIADSMHHGVRRYDFNTMIKIPVSLSELRSDMLPVLSQTTTLKAEDVRLTGKSTPGLLHIGEALKESVHRVHPLSGQHRAQGVKVFSENVETQLLDASTELNELTEELASASGMAKLQVEKDIQQVKSRIAYLKAEKEEGSSWLVALYNKGR